MTNKQARGFAWVTWKQVQELRAEVSRLESRIIALENRPQTATLDTIHAIVLGEIAVMLADDEDESAAQTVH